MVLERDLYEAYDRIRNEAYRASSNTLNIFVSANETDSIASIKLLTELLKGDSIKYSIFPVSGYEDIQRHADKGISQNDEYCCAILLNCGGTEDLAAKLDIGSKTTLFVIDSHRPLHLHNLSSKNKQVVVVCNEDDAADQDNAYPEIEELIRRSNPASEDELSEDEEEGASGSEDDDGYASSDGEGPSQRPEKRRRTVGPGGTFSPVARRREKVEWQRQKSEYYARGSFYGRACGLTLYRMAHLLNRTKNELLWYAIVAVTDQFIHERLTHERYQQVVIELEKDVDIASTDDAIRNPTHVILEDGTRVRIGDYHRIKAEDEPRLMLMRHWTLYNSIAYSSYVAAKLKTYTEKGRRQLNLMLADMGLPKKECEQKYTHMHPDVKGRLKEQLEKLGPKFGLDALFFRSFQLSHGFKSVVSAADMVYSLTALLEMTEYEGTTQADNFWTAVTALSNRDDLVHGIEHAKTVQVATVDQGSLAKQSKRVHFGKYFMTFDLEDPKDTRKLAHPLALSKLTLFIMEIMKESGKKRKPAVSWARMPGTEQLIVVGVQPRPTLGESTGNQLGILFHRVAEEQGLEYHHDGFETAWIMIKAKDKQNFELALHDASIGRRQRRP